MSGAILRFQNYFACKCHVYTILRMSFCKAAGREKFSLAICLFISRTLEELLNEKLYSTNEMCHHWMQKGLKEGHLPVSHFSRPEFRSSVWNAGYELVTEFLLLYRKLIRPNLQPRETPTWILTNLCSGNAAVSPELCRVCTRTLGI